MKNRYLNFWFFAIATLLVTNSCEKDEGATSPPSKLVMNLNIDGSQYQLLDGYEAFESGTENSTISVTGSTVFYYEKSTEYKLFAELNSSDIAFEILASLPPEKLVTRKNYTLQDLSDLDISVLDGVNAYSTYEHYCCGTFKPNYDVTLHPINTGSISKFNFNFSKLSEGSDGIDHIKGEVEIEFTADDGKHTVNTSIDFKEQHLIDKYTPPSGGSGGGSGGGGGGSGGGSSDYTGVWEAKWNCFQGQYSNDPGLTVYDIKSDGTYTLIKAMYDPSLKKTSPTCSNFTSYYVYNYMTYEGTWTDEGDHIALEYDGELEFEGTNLVPTGTKTNSCGQKAIWKINSNSDALKWKCWD